MWSIAINIIIIINITVIVVDVWSRISKTTATVIIIVITIIIRRSTIRVTVIINNVKLNISNTIIRSDRIVVKFSVSIYGRSAIPRIVVVIAWIN